jgi:hypothetical protein
MPDLGQIKQGEQGVRDQRRRFSKGRSGNPGGGRTGSRNTSAGLIAPSATAEVTAFIAGAIIAAISIGGGANLTVRSRQRGSLRSTQSRIAVGSLTSTSSTALRVGASDFPANQHRSGNHCLVTSGRSGAAA